MNEINLLGSRLFVRQAYELAEFIGFETRNKYEILNENHDLIGFAAEQQKGIFGFLFRQFLGHWRTFDLYVFNKDRERVLVCKHPFRFFFQRFEVYDHRGVQLAVLQQRFAILRKHFDILEKTGATLYQMISPLIKFWTFPILQRNVQHAVIRKRWSGGLTELMTDKDNFEIEFTNPNLPDEHRKILIAAAIFIDLQYFENKAKSGTSLFD